MQSLSLLRDATAETAVAASHTIVEVYATLTRLPAPFRLRPAQALEAARTISQRCTLIHIAADEVMQVLDKAAALNVQGGTTYDLLIASCAIKAGLEVLYTWNIRHYQLFGERVQRMVRTPDQA